MLEQPVMTAEQMKEYQYQLTRLQREVAELEEKVNKQAKLIEMNQNRPGWLPETYLLHENFFIRGLAVWGYAFLIQVIIAIAVSFIS